MNPRLLLVTLVGLWVASCSLDIARPAEKPAPVKAEYDVVSNDGTEIRHYDGNDALMWINRLELGTQGQQLKKYHYSAQDTLLWYEYRQFESFQGAWKKTKEQHFTPPKDAGLLVWSRAWDYAGDGVLVEVRFDSTSALSGYSHHWYDEVAGTLRTLQQAHFGADGTAVSFDRWNYDPVVQGRKRGWASLNGDRQVNQLRNVGFDDAGNETEVVEYASWKAKLSRQTRDWIPLVNKEFRSAWYTAPVVAAPLVPDFESPSTPALTAKPSEAIEAASNWTPPAFLSPAEATKNLPPPQLVTYPSLTLPANGDWTLGGFEYYLYGVDGAKITVRFDSGRLPTTLLREAKQNLEAIQVDLEWNLKSELVRRVVSYAGAPTLTVDFSRDDQGRITQVTTGGPAMRLPLTSTLSYADASARRPETLVLSTVVKEVAVDLMTLGFTYNDEPSGGEPFGLDGLFFDDQLRSIVAGAGAGADQVRLVELVFEDAVTADGVTTKIVGLWDVLNKSEAQKVQTGRLVWTLDAQGNQTDLVWQKASGSAFDDEWRYAYSWGKWATMADGIVDASFETKAEFEANASRAMGLVDSFDIEKVFQLVTPLTKILKDSQSQFRQSAGSLFDQIEASVSP